MNYLVIIERRLNSYGAYAPGLPGCGVVAETREEALQLIHGAVELHIEGLRDGGSPIPEPQSTIDYVHV